MNCKLLFTSHKIAYIMHRKDSNYSLISMKLIKHFIFRVLFLKSTKKGTKEFQENLPHRKKDSRLHLKFTATSRLTI